MRERRRRAMWLTAAAAACASVSFAPQGRAQNAATTGYDLIVQRAPAANDCLDSSALAARVNELAGRTALSAATSPGSSFVFEVQILKSDEGYVAIVLAAGKSRQIADPGPGCANLSEALALTLAILIDADAPAPVAPPPPPPQPTATFRPPPPPPRPPPPPPWYGPRLLISPLFGLSWGLSGDLVPGLTLVNDLRLYKSLSLLAGFTWMPAQGFALGPGTVEVQLMYGQIGPCLSTWELFRNSRFGACLQLDLGAIRGKGLGYDETREVTRLWSGLAFTGLLDVPIWGPIYWSSRVSGVAVITQESFTIDQLGTGFAPSPLGVSVATGVGLKIL